MTLHCFSQKEQSLEALAGKICSMSRAALEKRAFFSLVLAGGSTPEDLYALLASEDWHQRIQWDRTHIFFGDERCVPPEDRASNYRMVQRSLLAKLPLPGEHIHRIQGEADPDVEANRYEQLVQRTLAAISPHEPLFDCVLLGLGSDGHTASLFPGDDALQSTGLVTAVAAPFAMTPKVPRISLTLRGILLSRHLCFLVNGEEKKDIVQAVLADRSGRYPAGLVQQKNPQWFLSEMDCSGFLQDG
ncbi:MAG: 6-phosphogluconolactonase [Desulfopila sp.]|jgi:6-phosphogluconolactonase|nr:6-phosphogluconolactonase [Desulfopila sp.]